MAKRRKQADDIRASDELPKADVDEMENDFELDDDDDIDVDDSGIFEAGSLKGDPSDDIMLVDEPDEDELEDIDDDELLAESMRLDSAALADDPVRMYLKEIGQVPLLDIPTAKRG
jgi:RNA polymerase primary sigma factor